MGLSLPIAGLIGVGVKYNSTVEDLTTSFEVMTGSAEDAGKIVKELKDIGSKTPFEFTDLAETTKLLMNYGLTSDEAIDKMQMLGDISQGSADKMGRISTAYGQMSSAGKVNLEDVKQMIEAGFNPLKEISESTGESMDSLYGRISDGSLSVDEITKSMQRSTSEGGKYFGSMKSQSETTSGKMSTLKDGFLEAVGSLTESLIPALKDGVTWLTNLATWFSTLDGDQQKMILTVLGILAVLGPLVGLLGSIISLFGMLSGAMTFLAANPIVLLIIAIIAVVALLIMNFDKLKNMVYVIGNVLMSVFKAVGSFVAGIFKGIINGFIGMMNAMIGGINSILKAILSPFNAVIKGLNKIPGVNIPALKLAIPNIPKLEVGTNFVAQEGLAYLHQGEAVVPKKYNPAIGGGSYNSQTIVVEMPDIIMDGNKVSKVVTPYVTKTIKVSGGNI